MRFLKISRLTGLQQLRLLLLALLLPGQLLLPSDAWSSGLLIVYPKVKAPFNKIYEDIIKGINESYPGISRGLQLPAKNERKILEEEIKRHQPRVLVTLGKRSLQTARQLATPIPIVAGAITKTEVAVPGVSMSPDPELILSHLLDIAPFVKRVYVVADLERQTQLADAAAFLSEHGRVLQIEEAKSVQEAANKYLKIIQQASEANAIWLMRSTSLNDPSLLMLVLEAAWKKKIVIFSSNPSHVKRGALFSLYPDNEKMGRTLATIAQQHELELIPADTDLAPLRSVHLIVNKRTSKHLGIIPNNISGLTIHRLL